MNFIFNANKSLFNAPRLQNFFVAVAAGVVDAFPVAVTAVAVDAVGVVCISWNSNAEDETILLYSSESW